ncbi:MAG: biotin transporter BioY [Pseudomonadota bacterium]
MNAQQAVLAIVFAILIALAAQVSMSVPGLSIPITLQTVAVLVAGAVLGTNGAGFAVVLYLLMGTLGLGVFANGASGGSTLFGPSGGYLLGFWFAAVALGYAADRGYLWRVPILLPVWMLAAHAVILTVGAGLLSFSVGAPAAWFNGVAPFLPGALVKSLAAAILAAGIHYLFDRRTTGDRGGRYGETAEQDR